MSVWSSLYTLDPNADATEDEDFWDGFLDVARSTTDPDVLRIIVGRERTTLDCSQVFELRNVLTKWIRNWLQDTGAE